MVGSYLWVCVLVIVTDVVKKSKRSVIAGKPTWVWNMSLNPMLAAPIARKIDRQVLEEQFGNWRFKVTYC